MECNITYCRINDRTIFRVGDVYVLGCFTGTYKQAKKAIKKKYKKAALRGPYLYELLELKRGTNSIEACLEEDDAGYFVYAVANKTSEYDNIICHYGDVTEIVAKRTSRYHGEYVDTCDVDTLRIIAQDTREYDARLIRRNFYEITMSVLDRNPDGIKLLLDTDQLDDDNKDVLTEILETTRKHDEYILKQGSVEAMHLLSISNRDGWGDVLMEGTDTRAIVHILDHTREFDALYYDSSNTDTASTIVRHTCQYDHYYAYHPNIQVRAAVAMRSSLYDDILVQSDAIDILIHIFKRTRRYDTYIAEKVDRITYCNLVSARAAMNELRPMGNVRFDLVRHPY